MENRPYVSWETMNAFMIDVFKAYGVPAEDAAICADVLLESDRRGIESHGCNRFKPIYLNRIKNGTLLPGISMISRRFSFIKAPRLAACRPSRKQYARMSALIL